MFCIVVRRTLVTVEYEEKRKSQCTAPDKMLLFRVEINVVPSSAVALGRLIKIEEEEENPISTHQGYSTRHGHGRAGFSSDHTLTYIQLWYCASAISRKHVVVDGARLRG